MTIEIRNLSVNYRNKSVLKDINLKIDNGNFVGIVGPSGAGKSTLTLALAGLIPHCVPAQIKGSIELDGFNILDGYPEDVAGRVGIMRENPDLQLVSPTVFDELLFGPGNLDMEYREATKRAEEVLSNFNIRHLRDKNPREISGGERQLVLLSSILVMNPNVLVMDEPVSMLDPRGKSRILSAFESLKKENKIIMLTEGGQDIDQIMKFLDIVILLKRGKIIEKGSPEKICPKLTKIGMNPPQIHDLFLKLSRKSVKSNESLPMTADSAVSKLKSLGSVRENHNETREKKADLEKIVSVKNLDYSYPDGTEAIEGLNLDFYKGETAAIIGQNGSGKTTLALCLAGLYEPDNQDAEIWLKGRNVRGEPLDVFRGHVGYVFQAPEDQLFENTVREEISYDLEQLGISKKEIVNRLNHNLDLFGLKYLEDERVNNLSRGEKKRVSIASVAAMNPDLLIVDEPTIGMDNKEADEVFQALEKWKKSERTIVTILHNMQLVAEYSDRVIVFSNGAAVEEGTPYELFFLKKEFLESLGIHPPPVVEVSRSMSETSMLTVDEFVEAFILKGG